MIIGQHGGDFGSAYFNIFEDYEIKNKGFASDRHRVAAMIGRIARNETYISISAYELKN